MAPRLVAAMLVRNEAGPGRYLRMVLDDLDRYCDSIVALDDASTDETPEILASYDRVILHRNEESAFWQDESSLRLRLWNLALAAEPDWILVIDADEVLEERFKVEREHLLTRQDYDVIAFKYLCFWSPTHYRVDGFWEPRYKRLIARHLPGFAYEWDNFRIHSERIPRNLPGQVLWSDLRCRHYAYASPENRLWKYATYTANDRENDYSGIMDEEYRLEEWTD